MEKESLHPRLGMLGCDREVFSRVWARAAAHDRAADPIEVLPPTPVPAPVPKADLAAPPPPAAVPCLGRDSADQGRFLQSCIRRELENRRAYQALAARAGGPAARTLAAMAADELRHAKRLSGAYFLLTGIRFFPAVPPHRSVGGSFWGALRQWFWTEQTVSAAYAAAAEGTADPCLAALFSELSAEEAAHADLLRGLAEQMPVS